MRIAHGQILVSGPSNAAVDGISAAIRQVADKSSGAYHSNLPLGPGSKFLHRFLVVRGYPILDELQAFNQLLENPAATTLQGEEFAKKSHWTLLNSIAFWVLVVLESTATKEIYVLQRGDAIYLHNLRRYLAMDKSYLPLIQVAKGDITWDEYSANPVQKNSIEKLFCMIILNADVLATTPASIASSEDYWYKLYQERHARAVVVDEAAAMPRPDIHQVWGNTLLPCLLGGHLEKFSTTSINPTYKDLAVGSFQLQLATDAKVSAQEFLIAQGIAYFEPSM